MLWFGASPFVLCVALEYSPLQNFSLESVYDTHISGMPGALLSFPSAQFAFGAVLVLSAVH